MWAFLALSATVLTSILPILNKLLLRDARPALIAWAINAASLPLLAMGTLFFTQCTIETDRLSLTCSAHWPQIDAVFVAALLGSALLNWAATLLSSHALSRADASLVTPLLTFNPAFTLLVALVVLHEIPGLTPNALRPFFRHARTPLPEETSKQSEVFGGLGAHPRAFLAAAIVAGLAPLFGFTAIATGLVGYVTALFKLSAVFTILWARLFLGEGNLRTRLLGAVIMVLGGALVAA